MKEADKQIDKRVTISHKRKMLQEKVYKSPGEYNKKIKEGTPQRQTFELQNYVAVKLIRKLIRKRPLHPNVLLAQIGELMA